ncbi:MAG: cupin domain-containing protein [Actinomycetota bacterium]|nr:cupin domain-containing protein [Actinomycetota bacterium]
MGTRHTFLVTGEETAGEYVRVKTELPPRAPGPPMHFHLAYTESFEMVEGRLDLCVGRRNHVVLTRGQSALAPLEVPHRFWNATDEPTVFEAEIRPAGNFEKSIRAADGMARDGKTNDKGVPKNLFELALVYELSESYLVGMPLFLQTRLFGLLASIARRRGYDPEFSRYTRPGS